VLDLRPHIVLAMKEYIHPSLESMRGDSNARCIDFFAGYAEDLPPPLNGELLKIAEKLFIAHKRARLGALFKVGRVAVEQTIKDCFPDESPDGWRKAIEEQAGFEFALSNVPASAALIRLIGPSSVEVTLTKTENRILKGMSTISDDLLANGNEISESPIDEACFDVFSSDPLTCVCTELELHAFNDKVLTQFVAATGKLNFGMPLLRKMSAQAHKRVKYLPAYGKTSGADRRFEKMFYDKSVNRAHVSASLFPAHISLLTFPCSHFPVCLPPLRRKSIRPCSPFVRMT